ncbi:MAG: phosphomethylpyrimidine synthase ThiC, partial [Proteobacteria bacterium]
MEKEPTFQKVYIQGSIHPSIRVPMKRVQLHEKLPDGSMASLHLYDTSGPYTDPELDLDVKVGIPRLREQWILDRADTEERNTTQYLKLMAKAGTLPFDSHKPRRAKEGKNVSQMYYA